jgi:general secretion pathway protein C
MPQVSLQTFSPYLRFLPPTVTLLLVVLIGATLARMTWLLVPPAEQGGELPPAAAAIARPGLRINIDQIAGSEIFGSRVATKTGAPAGDAPETSLNLKLKGIFASHDAESSRALIADAAGKEKPYAVGDDVPGGATLHEIREDRVILERSGRFETLKLERGPTREGGTATAAYTPPAANAAPAGPAGTATNLAELRNEVMHDPSKASQYLRLQPVYTEGKLQGYRIYPGPNRQLFQQVGLRAGELVTSVNGVQLDDAAKALQLLNDLKEVQELTLTLERAGQTRSLNLNVNQ